MSDTQVIELTVENLMLELSKALADVAQLKQNLTADDSYIHRLETNEAKMNELIDAQKLALISETKRAEMWRKLAKKRGQERDREHIRANRLENQLESINEQLKNMLDFNTPSDASLNRSAVKHG